MISLKTLLCEAHDARLSIDQIDSKMSKLIDNWNFEENEDLSRQLKLLAQPLRSSKEIYMSFMTELEEIMQAARDASDNEDITKDEVIADLQSWIKRCDSAHKSKLSKNKSKINTADDLIRQAKDLIDDHDDNEHRKLIKKFYTLIAPLKNTDSDLYHEAIDKIELIQDKLNDAISDVTDVNEDGEVMTDLIEAIRNFVHLYQ